MIDFYCKECGSEIVSRVRECIGIKNDSRATLQLECTCCGTVYDIIMQVAAEVKQ